MMRGEIPKGKKILCYCPICQPTQNDNDRHLAYFYENEKLVVNCIKGCDPLLIMQHFPKKNNTSNVWTFLREHIYYTEDGSIFGKKVYYTVNGTKQPCWKRFENGEFINGLDGKKAGLYNIFDVMNNDDDIVWVVEGEKDVDTMKKNGFIATSPPNGAGAAWKAQFNQYFKRRSVVIIPDNDDIGKEHAKKVAKNLTKVAKSVRLLDLTNIVPELKKGGDVSDVFEELPNAKELLLELVTETVSEQTKNYDIRYVTNDEDRPFKTFDNFKLLLQYSGIDIRNNSISGVEFEGKLPKMTSENVENVSIIHLYSLSRETNINFSKNEISDYSLMCADLNTYNPVKDWLDGLDKTKKGYIRKYFDSLIFEEEEKTNKETYLTYFVKWLVQCVAMQFNEIYNPSGADGALGLQSQNEGIGKTSFFRSLCFDPRYFKDGVNLDLANKDSVRIATSFWICELGEVESTLTKDLARLKAFITEDYDVYRIPFATSPTKKPRRTSFCFTCNSDKFLKDGDNRRFWTIPIIGVNLEMLKSVDIKALWGEVYALYLKKPQGYRLTKEELCFLKENNREKFGFRINEEEVLRDKLDFTLEQDEWKYHTATDISDKLFGDRNHSRVIGKILTERLGYVKDRSSRKHYRIIRGIKEYHIPLSFVSIAKEWWR